MPAGRPPKKQTDADIIAQNPTLTPYQLLTEKGLSTEAFEQMVLQEDQTAIAKANSRPIQTQSVKSTPITSHHRPQAKTVWVINKNSGIPMQYSAHVAERMIRQHPNEFSYA